MPPEQNQQNSSSPDPEQPSIAAVHKPLTLQPLHPDEFAPNAASPITYPRTEPAPVPSPSTPPLTPPPTTEAPQPVPSAGSPIPKLLLVIALAVFAGCLLVVVEAILGRPGSLALLALLVPAVLIGVRRIEDILLPYAVSAAIVFATHNFLYELSTTTQHNTRQFVPLVGHWSNTHVAIIAALLSVVLSAFTFLTTQYGLTATKVISNIAFRFLAIWLIVFFPVYTLVNHASLKAQHAQYVAEKHSYDQTTLDARVPVYNPTLPAQYQEATPTPGDELIVHRGYGLYYDGSDGSSIQVKVSLDALPKGCENTMVPRAQTDASGMIFSCDIVFVANDNQPVYGYRQLFPANATADQIRALQPDYFYIQKGDALIQFSSSSPGVGQDPPLTPTVVNALVMSLQPVDRATRQAFVQRYIKEEPPIDLSVSGGALQRDYRNSALIEALNAAYLAVLLWAFEKIFRKAGRQYSLVYVPIVNLWILTKIAGRPGWWSLLAYLDTNPYSSSNANFMLTYIIFAPILVPLMLILTVVRFVMFLLASTSMAEAFGKSKLFSVLLIIPPFPGYLILGFGKSKYHEYDLVQGETTDQSPTSLAPPISNAAQTTSL